MIYDDREDKRGNQTWRNNKKITSGWVMRSQQRATVRELDRAGVYEWKDLTIKRPCRRGDPSITSKGT